MINMQNNVDFSLYDYLPVGICIVDENYDIIYWNKCLTGWTGYQKNELEKSNLLELYPNLSKPVYKMRIDLMFKGNPPTFFSSLLHKYFLPVEIKKGEYQIQSTTLISIPKKNEDGYYVLIAIENETNLYNRSNKYKQMKNKAIEEINKRIEAENKINEYIQELEETNAAKDKFFSIIAHDLKSPFSGFLNITKLLAEQLHSMTINDISELSSDLQESADTLYKLLENLLEWSRIQRKTIDFNPTTLNFYFIAKSNIDIQNELTKQKDLSLDIKVDKNLEIYADVSMINTIIRNLLSNAIKFTNKGGKIEIEAVKNESGNVQVFVRDNGIGIPEDNIDKLFKIDENISRPGTDGEPSSGLGLVLCKEFVEMHGGQISVDSTEGKGTSFNFTIPDK